MKAGTNKTPIRHYPYHWIIFYSTDHFPAPLICNLKEASPLPPQNHPFWPDQRPPSSPSWVCGHVIYSTDPWALQQLLGWEEVGVRWQQTPDSLPAPIPTGSHSSEHMEMGVRGEELSVSSRRSMCKLKVHNIVCSLGSSDSNHSLYFLLVNHSSCNDTFICVLTIFSVYLLH